MEVLAIVKPQVVELNANCGADRVRAISEIFSEINYMRGDRGLEVALSSIQRLILSEQHWRFMAMKACVGGIPIRGRGNPELNNAEDLVRKELRGVAKCRHHHTVFNFPKLGREKPVRGGGA